MIFPPSIVLSLIPESHCFWRFFTASLVSLPPRLQRSTAIILLHNRIASGDFFVLFLIQNRIAYGDFPSLYLNSESHRLRRCFLPFLSFAIILRRRYLRYLRYLRTQSGMSRHLLRSYPECHSSTTCTLYPFGLRF